MPRFYFDVHKPHEFLQDEDGGDFPDVQAAEREAIANALTVAGSLFPNRLADEVTIHMRDRNKQRIFSIALTMRAEEVGLAHGFVPAN